MSTTPWSAHEPAAATTNVQDWVAGHLGHGGGIVRHMPISEDNELTAQELKVFKEILEGGPPFKRVPLQEQADLEIRQALEKKSLIMLDPDGTAKVHQAGFVQALYRGIIPLK